MDADFSEFSYGYAAIREAEIEFGKTYKLAGAPKLPSLVEEENLGWDVRLAFVDFALFLQFKRSVFVSRRHPKSPTWHGPNTAHYRYAIDTDGHQHQALLRLQSDLAAVPGSGDVYYSAPVFHRQADFDRAYSSGQVLRTSTMVPPSDFGSMDGTHHLVATSPGLPTIMSEPRRADSAVTWEAVESSTRERAMRTARRERPRRFTVGDLDALLQNSVGRLERDIMVDPDASVMSRLHRSAAILGCGLALVALSPEDA